MNEGTDVFHRVFGLPSGDNRCVGKGTEALQALADDSLNGSPWKTFEA